MIEKNGMLTEESQSDFDHTKKAEYIDEKSPLVADEANKHKLIKPVRFVFTDKAAQDRITKLKSRSLK